MINEKYSFQSLKKKSFTGKKAGEFNNTIIQGTCFEQEKPFTVIFPTGMKNVTFRGCNLNNVKMPKGKTITVEDSCVALQWAYQADGEQWIVNAKGKPIKPLHERRFLKTGLSMDPADIEETPEPATLWAEKKEELALKEIIADRAKLVKLLRAEGKI